MRLLLSAMLTGGFMCFPAFSEENSGSLLTALSSTSISGYVNTASQWQTWAPGRAPAVGVAAIRPSAQEGKRISRSPGSGAFKFFRAGDIARPLVVYFLIDGTATAGVDYVASSDGKPFPLVSAMPPPGSAVYNGGITFTSGTSYGGVITSTGPGGIVGPPISITNLTPPVVLRVVDWIVIPAGRGTVTLTIDPIDDRRREMVESVIISISSDRSSYPSRASVHIIDNDY